jgi:hypothetical protein
MVVASTFEHCRTQLDELRAHSTEVCTLLRDLSRELLDRGQPPSLSAIERLRKFRADFEQLQSAIAIPDSASGTQNGECSLASLQEELDSQELIQVSLARVEFFSQVRHVEQPEFAPWQRCLADGTKLRDELVSAPTAVARLTAERFLSPLAPLNAIVTLLAEGRELSDERWSLLLDSVSAAYGREVSTAIARGKLVLMSGARA